MPRRPPIVPGSLDELSTDRLVLRRPTRADRDDLLGFYTDLEVMATLGGVLSAEDSDTRLAQQIAHWDAHHFGYWIAREPASDDGSRPGRFAGRAGLRLLVVDSEPVIEVGYGFMSDYWGRGIATEVASEIVRAAFEVVGVRDLVCFTTPTNERSRNVMEKVGFRYDKEFTHADLTHRLCRLDAPRWRREIENSETEESASM